MENKENYPQQIEDRIPEHWGKYLSIPETWYPLVETLDRMISEVAPDYVIHQVKEKYTGLRYYVDDDSIPEDKRDYVDAIIRFAEHYSYKI